ncbi:MAG: hypothetical protein AB1634_11320 [Thermodesulfobacteriota bacterium]
MKKLIAACLIVLFGTGLALASGGKHHGDVGQGKVATGGQAKGSSSQTRAGR